jgi:ubiquinone/menaquinone biosynthesis C-methylase UbiE
MSKTKEVEKKYNRFSLIYDLIESPVERFLFQKWRKKYLSKLKGNILEIGVGTGKNLIYYNNKAKVTAIDISEGMLEKAKNKQINKEIKLMIMDAQNLKFKSNSFDYIVTTCILCSIPDPVKALKEMKRVLKPNGKILMIEHVLSKNKLIALFEKIHNPITRFFLGVDINRNTKQNIKKSGLQLIKDKNLALKDVFRLFIAKK